MREIPTGLVPHIVVSNGEKAIEFYTKALGAKVVSKAPTPDGKKLMHAALKIGESTLFLSDDFPEWCGGKSRVPSGDGAASVTIHQTVPDCDAAIKRCADAGAKVNMPAADQFWGDRYGQVIDPFGHVWSFATPLVVKG